MAYEPTVWKNGDVITAEKLNKLENGVGSAGGGQGDSPIFIVDWDTSTISATFVDCTAEDVFNSCVENPNTKIQLIFDGNASNNVHLYLDNLMDDDYYQGANFKSLVATSDNTSSTGVFESVYTLNFVKTDTSAYVHELPVSYQQLIVATKFGSQDWHVADINALKSVYDHGRLEPVLVQNPLSGTTISRVFHLVNVDTSNYSEWDFLYSGIETVSSVTSMVYQKCHVDSNGMCTFSQEYRVALS